MNYSYQSILRTIYFKLVFFISLYFSVCFSFELLAQNSLPQAPCLGLYQESKWQSLPIEDWQTDITCFGSQVVVQHQIVFKNKDKGIAFPQAGFYYTLAQREKLIRFEMAVSASAPFREAKVTYEQANPLFFKPEIADQLPDSSLSNGTFHLPTPAVSAQNVLKIRLTILQELSYNPLKSSWHLTVPLSHKQRINDYVLQIKNMPTQVTPEKGFEDLYVSTYSNAFDAILRRKNFTPSQDLELELKYRPEQLFSTGRGLVEPYTFLSGAIKPQKVIPKRVLPKKLALLWDNSQSSQNKDWTQEIKFLSEYFKALNTFEIELITFGRSLNKRQKFSVVNGQAQGLLAVLNGLQYDGATDFSALNELQTLKVDELIFCSDGLQSYGKNLMRLPTAPVLCLTASEHHDRAFLSNLADSTNGLYLPLLHRSEQAALNESLAPRVRLLSASFDETQLSSFLPNTPTVAAEGHFKLSAKILADSTWLTLLFEDDQKNQFSERIMLKKQASAQGFWAEIIWLDHKILQLSKNNNQNFAAIKELSCRYNFPSTWNAWIWPENMNDYLRLGLLPPEEFKDEYNKYLATKQQENMWFALSDEEQNILKNKRLEATLRLHKAWYNAKFQTSEESSGFDRIKTANAEYLSAIESFKQLDKQFMLSDDINQSHPTYVLASTKPSMSLPIGTERLLLKPWQPKADYLNILGQCARSKYDDTYNLLKESNHNSVGFYVDCALFFWEKSEKDLALKVLSNLNEIALNNARILRLAASLLIDFKQFSSALSTLEQVAHTYAHEPQSDLDLARAYSLNAQPDAAVNAYFRLLMRPTSTDKLGLKEIALAELSNSLSLEADSVDAKQISGDFYSNTPVDLRIVARWNDNLEDVDLRVIDPWGNTVGDSVRFSNIGGRITSDVKGDYGAEEFQIKNAPNGDYTVELNATTSQLKYRLAPTNARVVIFTNYGRKNEEREPFWVTLTDSTPTVLVCKWSVEKPDEQAMNKPSQFKNLKLKEPVALALSQDEQQLFAISADELKAWNTHDGSLMHRIEGLNSGGTAYKRLTTTHDSTLLVLTLDSLMIAPESFQEEFAWMDAFFENSVNVLKILDIQNQKIIKSFIVPDSAIYEVVSHPKEKLVRVYTEKGVYKLDLVDFTFEVEKLHPVRGFTHLSAGRSYVAYTYKRKALFASTQNLRIIASVPSENILKTDVALDSAKAVCLNRIGSSDHLLLVDIPSGQTLNTLKLPLSDVERQFTLSNSGKYLSLFNEGERMLRILLTENASELMAYSHRDKLQDVIFGHQDKYLASADAFQQVRVRALANLPYYALTLLTTQPYMEIGNRGDFLCVATGTNLKVFEKVPNINPPAYKESEWINYNLRNAFKQASSLNFVMDKDFQSVLGIHQKHFNQEAFIVPLDSSLGSNEYALQDWLKNHTFKETKQLQLSSNKRFLAFSEQNRVAVLDIMLLTKPPKNPNSSQKLLRYFGAENKLSEVDSLSNNIDILIAFSPNGKLLAIKEKRLISIWNVATGLLLAQRKAGVELSKALAFTKDSKQIVFETQEHALCIWSFKQDLIQELKGHQGLIQDIDVMSVEDETLLLSASADNSMRVWDVKRNIVLGVFSENDPKTVFFIDNRHFSSLSQSGLIKFWQFRKDNALKKLAVTVPKKHLYSFKKPRKNSNN
ncbi:MAG: hypothetical protein EAZ57_05565 [Cytophagales bacterium]|nr:MAG: hypothetical protein EAZ67_12860 [Cytophagales bacterium]TAF61010.1 MAG: hypothetical protein EAZ57_05565 [Cytophagales bacterium]